MQLDNLNSRIYYVDKHVVITDSPTENKVIAWFRYPGVSIEKVTKIARRVGFRLGSGVIKQDESGSSYITLEAING